MMDEHMQQKEEGKEDENMFDDDVPSLDVIQRRMGRHRFEKAHQTQRNTKQTL